MIPGSPRQSILIVDDEPLFLSSVREGLARRRSDLDILSACHGQEALEILHSRRVDLVVTDLHMPVLDGFGLLSRLMSEQRGTPIIVMTAFGTPEIEENVRGLGAVAYIEKPIDLGVLESTIDRELRRAAKGHIQGITLQGFLQLLAFEQKTCTLTVSSEGRSGFLYFQEGELIDAEVGETRGHDAFYELEDWTAPEIDIEHVCRARRQTVFASMTELLLEGARRADEAVRDAAQKPASCSWTGRPALHWWDQGHGLLGKDGQPYCAVAVRLSDGAAILLHGTADMNDWAKPLLTLAHSARQATENLGQGSCEWVDGQMGIGIVWDTESDAALAVAEGLVGSHAAPWFRSQFSAFVRRIWPDHFDSTE